MLDITKNPDTDIETVTYKRNVVILIYRIIIGMLYKSYRRYSK